MTNFKRIKNMSIEEMASFLSEIQWDSTEPTTQEMLIWLESEVEE